MSLSASDFGYSIAGQLPGDSNPAVERYQGFIIRKRMIDPVPGGVQIIVEEFYWQEGGYFDTLQECRDDIADWNAAALDDDINPHEDTPSLDPLPSFGSY